MSFYAQSSNNQNKPPFLRALPIYILNLIILFLSLGDLDVLAIENVHIIFFIAPLYYWIIYQPNLMPLWFVFLSGLMIDISLDGLMGLNAFAFVVFYGVIYKSRRIIMAQPYSHQFAIFALSVVVFELSRWFIMSVLTWQLWAFLPMLLAIVINIVTYLPITLVLRGGHRLMLGNGRASKL